MSLFVAQWFEQPTDARNVTELNSRTGLYGNLLCLTFLAIKFTSILTNNVYKFTEIFSFSVNDTMYFYSQF